MTSTSINGDRYGATAVSSSRFCNVNIVMTRRQVSAVNYIGPTGGLLTVASNVGTPLNAARRLAEGSPVLAANIGESARVDMAEPVSRPVRARTRDPPIGEGSVWRIGARCLPNAYPA